MAAQFGGKPYTYDGNGGLKCKATEGGLKGMWHAFIPGGQDDGEGQYANIAGNQLGSWLMRINYNADTWKLGVYAEQEKPSLLYVFPQGHDARCGTEYQIWQMVTKYCFGVYPYQISEWTI